MAHMNPQHGPAQRNRWLRRLQTASPINVICDVGAANGQSSARYRKACPNSMIYAFEPSPTQFDALTRCMAGDQKFVGFLTALGENRHTTALHRYAHQGANSLLPGDTAMSSQPCDDVPITVQRLDWTMKQHNVDQIDILKVDAQGYDGCVLRGAGNMLTPSRIRGICIELLFAPFYKGQSWAHELIAMLHDRGYRLFDMVESNWRKGALAWVDGLFLPR